MEGLNQKTHFDLEFINAKIFIEEHYQVVPYKIVVSDNSFIENMKLKKFQTGLCVQNETLDCNLRVIESYMPEYIFLLGKYSCGTLALREIIKKYSFDELDYIPSIYRKSFLERKFYNYIEALIYSDFGLKPWRAKWIENRCFVLKNNGELMYYTKYDYRQFINLLFDILAVELIQSKKNSTYYDFSLKFLK